MDASTFSSLVMFGIIVVIIGVLIYAFVKREKSEKLAQTSVILGILGTFIGVAIGLYAFDVNDIDASLPKLLGGLKTAFITSIVGQIASLIINNFVPSPKVDGGIARNEIDMADLHDSLIAIQKSIAGDGETTLISQIKLMRQDSNDNSKKLITSFDNFAKDMAENNSKALIEALEEVMRDFNAKINEQFGDNFKQLNSAVGQMLDWQKEYKEFVETTASELRDTTEIVKNAVSSLVKTEKVLDDVTKKTEVFQSSAQKFDELLVASSTTLQSLNEIGKNSKNIFPQLENDIRSITTNVSTLINDTSSQISQQAQKVTSVYSDMQNQIHDLVKQTSEALENQVTKLDRELGEELNKALETLGGQLLSLSNQFVKDYSPLTEKLRNIVEISKGIN